MKYRAQSSVIHGYAELQIRGNLSAIFLRVKLSLAMVDNIRNTAEKELKIKIKPWTSCPACLLLFASDDHIAIVFDHGMHKLTLNNRC